MDQLLKFLLSRIVDRPEAVAVTSAVAADGTVVLTVAVDPIDMGKVIGRGGKVIGAIRELLKVKAIKTNQRVRVILAEPASTSASLDGPQTDLPSPPPPLAESGERS